MEHLKQETVSGAQLNMAALYQICPQCFTESKDPKTSEVRRSVDFEKLRLLLGDNVAEGDERYDFTWVGKRAALQEAAKPIRKTLRPCPEESVDWENTKNLYIEGDNLEVLKLLQNSYMGKVKMIYIDPPYNTGNDFVYHDDFHQNKQDYDLFAGDVNEEGERLVKNTESNGRFHSDWCSMIYSRLMVARSLLQENGVIFISIDENEISNMRKICDEIFGPSNHVDSLHWKKKKQPSFLAKHTAKMMEYVIVYAKDYNSLEKLSVETLSDATKKVVNISNQECIRHFKSGVRVKIGERGVIKKGRYRIKTMDIEYLSDVRYANGKTIDEVDVCARFSVSQDKINHFIDDDLLFITANSGLRRDVSEEESQNKKAITDLLLADYGDNQESDKEFMELFEAKYFDYTKPIKLLYNLAKSNETENQIILDFFSGSATTAHAVMQLNVEDGGFRKFIMVQLPEKTAEDSEAYKAGYKNICEIGKERIRRAGKKILEEQKAKQGDLFSGEQKIVDVGFRVFKCSDSNMKDVYYAPTEYSQELLLGLEDNIKEDRNDLDLLFGCMLDWGVTLDLPLRTEKVDGINIHVVNEGDLVACFEKHIPESVIDHIASLLPMRVVLRDSCFDEAKEKMNFFEIFKQRTGWSEEEIRKNVKVI